MDNQRKFALIGTNAGGEGKTFATMLLQCTFQMLGMPVSVFDADPGNRALRVVTLVNDQRFYSIIMDGISNHQHSANAIRQYVWRFVDQPGVRKIFGNDKIDQLQSLLDVNSLNIRPFTLPSVRDDRQMEELAMKAEFYRIAGSHWCDPRKAIKAISEKYNMG